MVFCENRNLEVVKDSLLRELGYQSGRDFEVDTRRLVEMHKQGSSPRELLEADIGMSVRESSRRRVFPNVDGIKFLSHQGGCGSTPNDLGSLLALLAGYVTHPNVAGATILSLGCQQAQSEFLLEEIRKLDPSLSKPLFFLEQQQSKSERDFIAEAVKKTFVGLIEANEAVRQPAGLKKLVVGLECGGSDGFSGISANPAPGNIRDGLITDAMKSAGAARKGGTSPIVAVLDYTEQVTKPGLNLLCTPGNDVESTTGLAGSGANLIVFTTGLGTPTGNVVAGYNAPNCATHFAPYSASHFAPNCATFHNE